MEAAATGLRKKTAGFSSFKLPFGGGEKECRLMAITQVQWAVKSFAVENANFQYAIIVLK